MKWGHLIIAILAVMLFGWVMVDMNLASMAQQLKAMRIAIPIAVAERDSALLSMSSGESLLN
jgi:hypothetical protein